MSNYFNLGKLAVEKGPKVFKGIKQAVKTVTKKLKGNKTSPTITAIKPGTKLTRKRKEQDEFVKSRDKILQGVSPTTKTEIKTKNPLTTLKSKVKNILTPDELAKGGRVGLKKGTPKRKTNVEKIKKAFGSKKSLGMQSVIYGLDKNPKITAADPKAKFIAAANKKKKKKVI
jgi:hypothetical protein